MTYNPIDILKELLNGICEIDKESFDKAELECYRKNLLMCNFVFTGTLYDQIKAILTYINYFLVLNNGKLIIENDRGCTSFITRRWLIAERGDVIRIKDDGDYVVSYILDNKEIVARRIYG